jgi:hypothetical protein|tara:strand:+ start:163 stop:405 length:243 start_codon:yes stop_codon:yes gene_type:complete
MHTFDTNLTNHHSNREEEVRFQIEIIETEDIQTIISELGLAEDTTEAEIDQILICNEKELEEIEEQNRWERNERETVYGT